MRDYPLYFQELGNVYMSLVFWDQQEELLKSLRISGDLIRYVMTIDRWDINAEQHILTIEHSDGHTLLVETEREKLIVYMYKERDNYYSLVHPGLRYQYFVRSRSDYWTKINEGTLAVSPVRVVSPRQAQGSTFEFDVSLVERQVYIDDGLHVVQFALDDIGGTIDSTEKQYRIDQPRVCEHIEIDVYEDMDGQAISQISQRNTAYIVAK
jgi:hypothetical protein